MRIAAGVLIIIVAVMDIFAGFGYLLGGALVGGVGKASEEIAKDPNMAKDPNVDTAKMREDAKKVQSSGALIAILGLFFLTLGGLAIASGIVIFQEKAATFAIAIGLLQIIGDGISSIITTIGITNIFAIIVGMFVIFAAKSYKTVGASTTPPSAEQDVL